MCSKFPIILEDPLLKRLSLGDPPVLFPAIVLRRKFRGNLEHRFLNVVCKKNFEVSSNGNLLENVSHRSVPLRYRGAD